MIELLLVLLVVSGRHFTRSGTNEDDVTWFFMSVLTGRVENELDPEEDVALPAGKRSRKEAIPPLRLAAVSIAKSMLLLHMDTICRAC